MIWHMSLIGRLLKRKDSAQNDNPYRCITLKGEEVKSYGEKEIADFLFTHGIEYSYEEPYPYVYGYRPDFHITGTKVWIEYFGIDRDGNVPDWFEGKNPSKDYKKQMKWKRKVHKKHRTRLISLYSYQRSEGALISELSKQLRRNRIR